MNAVKRIVFMAFLVSVSIMFTKEGRTFRYGLCTCYVRHILGACTAGCGNRARADHQGGVFLTVPWNF